MSAEGDRVRNGDWQALRELEAKVERLREALRQIESLHDSTTNEFAFVARRALAAEEER